MGTLQLEPRLPSEQFESTRRQLNCNAYTNFAAISQRPRYVKNSNITTKLLVQLENFQGTLYLSSKQQMVNIQVEENNTT